MKNRDFMIAGSLLLGFCLTAQAQKNDDQLYFYGFEDNLSSFTDSSKPLDSIMKLRYYTKADDGGGSKDITGWTLDPVEYDTALYLLNGLSPYRADVYESVYVETDQHQQDMKKLGALGGNYYLHVKTGKNTDGSTDESADYQGCLFIRNIPIEDYTSYRLVYYRKTDQPAQAKMYSGILRGYYNSEKSISMDGGNADGTEFMKHETSGITSNWQRVTLMTYYQNDSVANHHCYMAGYWWTSGWSRLAADGSGQERVYIEQPDKFFVRLTFSAPETDYYIDDIALYKSSIGGAESNVNIIRVNFGYETNLKDLANASDLKSIELPGEYFTITGVDSFIANSAGAIRGLDETDAEFKARCGADAFYERSDIPVTSAEYHNDGYMYIFLADNEFNGEPQNCDFYGDIRISFTNPVDNPKMALKYNGTLFPNSLDTTWVKAGKLVPNFSNEFVLPNISVSATPVALLAPTALSIEPTTGSFKLPANTTTVKVRFNKPVYCDPGVFTDKGVLALFRKAGTVETWLASAFNATDSTVVFTRQGKDITAGELSGDYVIEIIQARAGASYDAAPIVNFALTFGTEMAAPDRFARDDFQTLAVGDRNPAGFTLNASCMMRIGAFKGLVTKALMFGLYGENLPNGAPILTYTLTVTEPGTKYVSFAVSGCKKSSWNDAAMLEFRIFNNEKALGDTIADAYQEWGGSDFKPEEGGTVTGYDEYKKMVTFPKAGTYSFEWKMPNENSYGGGHKGGRVLYYFDVSNNEYSNAYKYIEKVDGAFAEAEAMKVNAEAVPKFAGSVLNALSDMITLYDGFTTSTTPIYTNPNDYIKAASDLSDATSAMKVRIDTVGIYEKEYHICDSIANSYDGTDTANVAVVLAAKALMLQHKSLNLPATEPADLRIIIKNIQNATKAMNDRQVLAHKFIKLMTDVSNVLDVKKTYNFFAEYPALETAYNNNKGLDIILGTDAEINAAITAVQNALNTFNGKLDGALAMAHQARLLVDLANTLGVDFDALSTGSADKLTEIMTTLDHDNAGLVAALKLAIKAKMYEMIAANELPADLDLSGFITNPGLYCTAVIDTQVEWYNYTHSTPNDRWRAKKGTFTDVYPGWSLKVNAGNVHVGNETRNWVGASPVFDGYVAADWNSGFSLTQMVDELPLGIYSIGVAYNNDVANNGCNLMVSTAGQDTTYIDTVIVKSGSQDYIATPNIITDDMAVSTGSVDINLNHANVSGWARVDNFALTYKAAFETGVDYANLAAELNTAAAAAITDVVTGVESVTVSGSVKYYNLNGIRLTAPQKGINIRVTTGADGKRVSEKILVK